MTAPTHNQITDRFIRRHELIQITSLPSSSITDMVRQGDFPKPYKIAARSSAWKASEVKAWMDTRPQTGEIEHEQGSAEDE